MKLLALAIPLMLASAHADSLNGEQTEVVNRAHELALKIAKSEKFGLGQEGWATHVQDHTKKRDGSDTPDSQDYLTPRLVIHAAKAMGYKLEAIKKGLFFVALYKDPVFGKGVEPSTHTHAVAAYGPEIETLHKMVDDGSFKWELLPCLIEGHKKGNKVSTPNGPKVVDLMDKCLKTLQIPAEKAP